MRIYTNKVKYYRNQMKLTQAELADKVDVSRNTISSIERQEYIPSVIVALKISKTLGIPVEELFICQSI